MSIELDPKVLEPFRKIFANLNIDEGRINLLAGNFSPTLTPEERRALSESMPLDGEILYAQSQLLLPPAPFEYKDHIVLVYQRDQYLTRENYAQGKLTRFHLCFCKALRDAKDKNRYESRYVMTFDTSGNFFVNIFVEGQWRERNVYRPLKACQHCLRELNWKNFRQYCGAGRMTWKGGNFAIRRQIVDEFDIAEYLSTAKQNRADFPTLSYMVALPIKEYVLSPQIKFALKKNLDFSCELCRRQFPPDVLEIHHRNHNQGDNRRDNLLVLCTSCHNLIHAAEGGVFTEQRLQNVTAAELKLLYEAASANGNTSVAKNFYRKAVNEYKILATKNLDALFELANLTKLAEAKKYFCEYLSRAKKTSVREMIRVALIYAKGLGANKNLSAARKYFDEARKRGKPEDFICREFIELCKLLGETDKANRLYGQAAEIFEAAQASRPKDWAARYELAKLYGDDDFTPKLFAEATEKLSGFWDVKRGDLNYLERLKQSARVGDAEAQAILERLYADADERKKHSGVLVLREGITVIERERFSEQREITQVVFPESLTEIGDGAFRECGLRSLVLPAALKKIGGMAFADSTDPVESVTYPRQIEPLLKKYFGARWATIKKTRRP